MKPALYQVGQHVAVCSSTFTLVIPATVVERVFWDDRLSSINQPGLVLACWTYVVVGHYGYIAERCLRPINPDTEYQDQPQTTEIPDTQEAV